MFSAQSKLCFVRDQLSGKDFLVDTGAPLSLLPHQSTAAVTGPKLQSMKGQLIKTWNFVVPFLIIGLDFLRFFGMQVDPSSSDILVASSAQRTQEDSTAGGGGSNAAHACFSAKKEVLSAQPKAPPPPVLAPELVLTHPFGSCGASAHLVGCHLRVHGH
jgi:hypothetical protein